jgi:MoaA/NifB/PqqE/SkfB family radical SAM enzyme
MPLDSAKHILRQLKDVGVKSVVYSGGGSPLLNPDFDEIVEYGCSLGLDQGVYTNGTEAHKHIDALRSQMKWVYVSLDAATGETYFRIKGKGLFQQVLSNIALLTEEKSEAKIGVGFLVSEENMDEAISFAELCRGLKVDYVQYRPAVVEGINRDWLREVMRCLKLVESMDPRITIAWYKFKDLLRQDSGRTYAKCYGHNFLGGISANCTVWFCLNYRYRQGYDIGSLKNMSFEAIWQGRRRKELMERIDVTKCPKLCRPHELNKALDIMVKGNPHENFL